MNAKSFLAAAALALAAPSFAAETGGGDWDLPGCRREAESGDCVLPLSQTDAVNPGLARSLMEYEDIDVNGRETGLISVNRMTGDKIAPSDADAVRWASLPGNRPLYDLFAEGWRPVDPAECVGGLREIQSYRSPRSGRTYAQPGACRTPRAHEPRD